MNRFILILVSSLAVVGSSPSSKRRGPKELFFSPPHASCALPAPTFLPIDGSDERCSRKTDSLLAKSSNIQTVGTAAVVGATREKLERQLAVRPDLALVTCASETHQRHRLRPLLVLELPLAKNKPFVQGLVRGDCGNDLFAYVATHTSGPSLIRTDALSGVSNVTENTPAIILGWKLWKVGWKIAMISCEPELSTAPAEAAMPSMEPHVASLLGTVELHNTLLVEARLNAQFPLVKAPLQSRPALPPRPSTYPSSGITVLVMAYKSRANADSAKRLLAHMASLDVGLVAEVVLLWNRSPGFTPPADFLGDVPRSRMVLAATNDLTNRMDMRLVRPQTAAVMALDDDQSPPPTELLQATYDRWLRSLGRSNAGLGDSRGAPISIEHSATGSQPLCRSVYAYLGHPFCPNGRSWVVETPFIYHQHYADEFSRNPAFEKIRSFVQQQPSHPDDLAFGSFVNWASQQPALCSNDKDGQARRQLRESRLNVSRTTARSAAAASYQEEEEEEEEGERRARRRLGLSGGPDWLYARTHGAMWILHFFGGFFNPYGCWVTGRSGERPSVPALPPTNRRATDRNGEAVKCHRTEAEADAAQAQAQHSAR